MPRFYFYVQDGQKLSRDVEGFELPTLEQAREQAAQALAEWVRFASTRSIGRQIVIEIRDQARELLLRMAVTYEVNDHSPGRLH